MKKSKALFYIPLVLLFALTTVVFVIHARPVVTSLVRILNPGSAVRFPFEQERRVIIDVLPEAEAAGIRKGDALVGIGGRPFDQYTRLVTELDRFNVGDMVIYSIERKSESGEVSKLDIPVEGVRLSMTFRQAASDFGITILFLLLLPATSFLLGFYVAFMRPRDPLAWVLLFMLLGIGAIATTDWPEGTIVRTFQETVMNFLGVWMVLFGVYFPERSSLDKRRPWIKWVLLVPLTVVGTLSFAEQLGRVMGAEWLWRPVDRLTDPYDAVFTILTMISFGFFFANLAAKSSTLENRDSRRRLRILYVGCSSALLPSLFVIIYRIASGKEGGFFQLVPGWFAILALVSLLLFPLTMAYVIVVQRAMDVSVVVRQGLQYALAKNGVLAMQIVLSFLVILIAASFVTDTSTNRPQKITFMALGVTFVFLIRMLAEKIKTWTDRKFFREAYNAEQILSDLSEDVRTMVETKPLLEIVAAKISESMHVPQIALLLTNGGAFKPAYAIGFADEPTANLAEHATTIERLRTNEPVVIYQDDEESWGDAGVDETERESLRDLNAQLLLPIGAKNKLSGVISLGPKLSEEPYSPNDLRLLRSVAAQTGIALENSRLTEVVANEAAQKERLNRELEIAREVQERLFPQELPRIEGLDFFGACRPALGVGGDYYDFLELPEHKFGIAIGDISGKGIGASLMMASLQASLRGQTIHFGNDLAALMDQVNSLVYEASTTNRYATFFYAQYDPASMMLSYVNAGHNPPFLIRKSGEVVGLDKGGPVVGMLPPMLVEYEQGEIELAAGDMLVGYTDGISEAMNPAEEEWGEDAMLEHLKGITDKTSEEIIPLVVAAADKFANGAKQHDDMTMIVVKVL